MEKITEKLQALTTKDDFVEFMLLLKDDLADNRAEWANNNLHSYLQAIANWTEDMDEFYKKSRLPIPSNVDWKVFANILLAAKMYE